MTTRQTASAEKQSYRDTDTGRTVTLWTGATGVNLGLYYHQHAFDAARGFVYFISNRSGLFQIWRVALRDGRLTQVTDLDGFGEFCMGFDAVESSYNYAVHVSRRSGKVFCCGRQRIWVVDPDTLKAETIWDKHASRRDEHERCFRETYVFPSCDDRWVYSSGVFASDAEVAAARQYAKAVAAARRAAGLPVHAEYHWGPHGLSESPLEHVIWRVETATGRVQELWRGHWWVQHVQASPTDPDLVMFLWAAMVRPKPKYFLMRAGEPPGRLLDDEVNVAVFHDFWHPDGTKWFAHSCENLKPDEGYAPIPGKMKFYVCEVNIAEFQRTGRGPVARWLETAGEQQVHLHLNIAPDGAFLVGDGQSDCPFISRLDWQPGRTLTSQPLCRAGYAPGRPHGCETSPNVQVYPDGRSVFFTTYRGDRSHLASVECGSG